MPFNKTAFLSIILSGYYLLIKHIICIDSRCYARKVLTYLSQNKIITILSIDGHCVKMKLITKRRHKRKRKMRKSCHKWIESLAVKFSEEIYSKMRSITLIVTLVATLFFTAHEVDSLMVVIDPPGKRGIYTKSNILHPQQGRQDNLRLKKYSKLYQVILPFTL